MITPEMVQALRLRKERLDAMTSELQDMEAFFQRRALELGQQSKRERWDVEARAWLKITDEIPDELLRATESTGLVSAYINEALTTVND